MTGLEPEAVHGVRADPLIRLAGNPAGSAPGVEATLTCSTPGRGGEESVSRTPSSPGPGRASAAARTPNTAERPTVNTRAIGAVAAGAASANGDGTRCWKEKEAGPAERPGAGWSRRVTRTPGISTSEIPAPG